MAINLDAALIQIIVSTIIVSPILWLAGRAVVGGEKARLTDAIWIVVLGIVIGGIFGWLFVGIVALVVQLFIWVALVRHFFDTGWLTALGISILAVVIIAVIAAILILIGLALWSWF